MSSTPFTSTLVLDAYPERQESRVGWLEHAIAGMVAWLRKSLYLDPLDSEGFIKQIEQHRPVWESLNETERQARLDKLRYALVSKGLEDELVASAFALIQNTAQRVLGVSHYNVQFMGGWIMLNGMIAEMETGEGKTLTATLPAATAAMARIPVHIITANDYLAARDAALMGPLYKALGLSVGLVTAQTRPEARRQAYACDITYCTNKQLALDYLRDRLKRGASTGPIRERLNQQVSSPDQLPLLRGLCYAIVDEADSVLIDDARIPLVLAKEQSDTQQYPVFYQALTFARLLELNQDFLVNFREPGIMLTEQGRQRISEFVTTQTADPSAQTPFEALILLALKACYLFKRDKHYLVKDNKILIIDENTGRTQTDRSWQHGLHQMIECKEGCALSSEKEVLARLTFQRFFRRYLHLAGMTGTAREVSRELRHIYQLEVVPVPTRRTGKRVELPDRVYPCAAGKWLATVKRIKAIHKTGRPVLIGTRSVKDTEYLSELLQRENLPHQVLNARQDQAEARIIAGAGKTGQITIATNMAGRGTDIKLEQQTASAGGLHVISIERNDAKRIDRQLYGRCARLGQPGSCEAILSLQDTLIQQHIPKWLLQWLQRRGRPRQALPHWSGRLLMRWAQWTVERQHNRIRRSLLQWDMQQEQTLAFSAWKE